MITLFVCVFLVVVIRQLWLGSRLDFGLAANKLWCRQIIIIIWVVLNRRRWHLQMATRKQTAIEQERQTRAFKHSVQSVRGISIGQPCLLVVITISEKLYWIRNDKWNSLTDARSAHAQRQTQWTNSEQQQGQSNHRAFGPFSFLIRFGATSSCLRIHWKKSRSNSTICSFFLGTFESRISQPDAEGFWEPKLTNRAENQLWLLANKRKINVKAD